MRLIKNLDGGGYFRAEKKKMNSTYFDVQGSKVEYHCSSYIDLLTGIRSQLSQSHR